MSALLLGGIGMMFGAYILAAWVRPMDAFLTMVALGSIIGSMILLRAEWPRRRA